MSKIFSSLLIIFSLLLLSFFAYTFNIFLSTPGHSEQKKIFIVKPGNSFSTVSKNLIEKDLVLLSPYWLKIFGRVSGYAQKIQVGEYELNRGMTLLEIFDVLSSGKSIKYDFTVKEGLNMFEIANLLEEKGLGLATKFLKLCQNKKFIQTLLNEPLPNLEGYLFPETYTITKFTGEKNLIKLMVEHFLKVYNEVIQNSKIKMNRHAHVILASLIEKETGAPEERTLISSVFHNRLKRNMRLQSDPTILYGILDETKIMKKNITKKDILHKNRFNTYRISGLPFGPIANAGKEALLATLNPANSDFLYFVSRNNGTHKFSKTYKEHLKAVRLYQLRRAL